MCIMLDQGTAPLPPVAYAGISYRRRGATDIEKGHVHLAPAFCRASPIPALAVAVV